MKKMDKIYLLMMLAGFLYWGITLFNMIPNPNFYNRIIFLGLFIWVFVESYFTKCCYK